MTVIRLKIVTVGRDGYQGTLPVSFDKCEDAVAYVSKLNKESEIDEAYYIDVVEEEEEKKTSIR